MPIGEITGRSYPDVREVIEATRCGPPFLVAPLLNALVYYNELQVKHHPDPEDREETWPVDAITRTLHEIAAVVLPEWKWWCRREEELEAEEPYEPPAPYRKKKMPIALRTAVFERDTYRCVCCGDWRELQADHVIPESKGGMTCMDNLQTLCGPCNRKKHNKMPANASYA